MSNPAERLTALFDSLTAGDQSKSGFEQWFRALQIDRSSGMSEEEAIAGMQAALTEVRGVEQLLGGLHAPPLLFEPTATRLRRMFSPANAASAARDCIQSQLHSEIRTVLHWASWVLREFNQPDIPGPDLEELLATVQKQEQIIEAGGLSPYIRDLLTRQVADIRRALRLYTVQGSGPVQEAYHKSVAALASVPKTVVEARTEADARAVKQSGDVLKRVGEISRAGTDFLNFLTNVASSGQAAISHITQVFLPPPQ